MLNREEIRTLVSRSQLVSGYIDLETQLTPNGFDLTCAGISAFSGSGSLDFSNKERVLPRVTPLVAKKEKAGDEYGWWALKPGAYKVATNETVRLPKDMIAVAFPRSSLLRMGVFTQNGVWDAGFTGTSEFVLHVANPKGVRIKQNARLIQLLFTRINETAEGYNGMYQQAQEKKK
jgi:dUTP pyrophosphatase